MLPPDHDQQCNPRPTLVYNRYYPSKATNVLICLVCMHVSSAVVAIAVPGVAIAVHTATLSHKAMPSIYPTYCSKI